MTEKYCCMGIIDSHQFVDTDDMRSQFIEDSRQWQEFDPFFKKHRDNFSKLYKETRT